MDIIEIKLFDVWGINFVGQFVSSHGMKYVLVAVDYILMWVEASVFPKMKVKASQFFLKKNIFYRFGKPRVTNRDGGYLFWSHLFKDLFDKYGVKHKVETPNHP